MIGGTDENIRLLRIIVRLLSMQLLTSEMPRMDRARNQRENIRLLNQVGFTVGEIADLLGTTPNTVSVALVGIRREAAGKKAKPKAAKKSPAKSKPLKQTSLPLLEADDPKAGGEG